MDSLLLVQLLTQQKNIPWRIWHLWSELTLLLGSPSPTVTHIYREANGLADSLANAGCELLSMEVYFMADALPRRSKGIYLLDKAQMPNIRVRKSLLFLYSFHFHWLVYIELYLYYYLIKFLGHCPTLGLVQIKKKKKRIL